MPAALLFKTVIQSKDASLDPAGCDFVYYQPTISTVTALLANDVSVGINHFYNVLQTGATSAVCQYLGPSLDISRGLGWTAYDITAHLNGSPHGAPIASGNYSIPSVGTSTTVIPEGVAACLSYRGNYGTDVEFLRDPVTHKITARPRARHRGRIYLGPLDQIAFQQDSTTKRGRLKTLFMTDIMAQLQGAISITDSASNKWQLWHWSKKNASVEPIVQAWVDDRPDYQRRRSDQSTTRSTVTITYP